VKAPRFDRTRILAFCSLLLFLLVSGNGCSISDLFPPRLDNQVAYFNTYYNASRLYKEAILEIETTERSQRERGLPPQKEISQNVRQKLTGVIEKCSKLLMYYPNSKWVDDALMLIGKSYFYMGEYPKAERKFNELLEQIPNSDLILEAHLWLGKSYRRSSDFEQGIRELKVAAETAIVQGEGEIAAEALLTLGEIYDERGSYAEAIAAYQDVIARTDEHDFQAQAQYRIGELHEKKGAYAEAAAAYQKVRAFDPDDHLKYLSQLRFAVNATQAGQYEEAMNVLNGLLANNAYSRFFPTIKLEIANTLRAMGQIEEAIRGYQIIDTMYARTDAAAKGYYQLGLLYEKTLRNYRAADTNYARARSEYPPSEITPLATRRAENLRRYFLYRQSIYNTDSLLVQAYRSQAASPDTTQSVPVDSSSRRAIGQDSARGLHFEIWGVAKGSPTLENLRLTLARHTYDLGTLFFLDLEEPDSALFWCTQTTLVSPDSDLAARALFTIAEIRQSHNPHDQSVVDSIYNRIISEYPRTKYAAEVRRLRGLGTDTAAEDPAASLYRQAEQLMLSNRGPEAIGLLERLLKEYPLSSYCPKAQYAIGWIYENIGHNSDSAIANYRKLLNRYPASTYSASVGTKVMEAELDRLERAAPKDSSEQGGEGVEKEPPRQDYPSGIAPTDTTSMTDRKKTEEDEIETIRGRRKLPPTQGTKRDTTKIFKER